jgi:hypothetical protein
MAEAGGGEDEPNVPAESMRRAARASQVCVSTMVEAGDGEDEPNVPVESMRQAARCVRHCS